MSYRFNFEDLRHMDTDARSTSFYRWVSGRHEVPWSERAAAIAMQTDYRHVSELSPFTARLLERVDFEFAGFKPSPHAQQCIEHEYQSLARIDGGVRHAPPKQLPKAGGNASATPTPAAASAASSRDSTPYGSMDSSTDSLPSLTRSSTVHESTLLEPPTVTFGLDQHARVLTTATASPAEVNANHLPCALHFLGCHVVSEDVSQWHMHCTSHLQRLPPPIDVGCPLCSATSMQWDQWLQHLSGHLAQGQRLAGVRPDGKLLLYLDKIGLIDKADIRHIVTVGSLAAPYGLLDDQYNPTKERRQRDGQMRARRLNRA